MLSPQENAVSGIPMVFRLCLTPQKKPVSLSMLNMIQLGMGHYNYSQFLITDDSHNNDEDDDDNP